MIKDTLAMGVVVIAVASFFITLGMLLSPGRRRTNALTLSTVVKFLGGIPNNSVPLTDVIRHAKEIKCKYSPKFYA